MYVMIIIQEYLENGSILHLHPLMNIPLPRESVQEPDRMTGISSPFITEGLQLVQFLQNPERYNHLVFLERENRVRFVNEYIRVNNESFYPSIIFHISPRYSSISFYHSAGTSCFSRANPAILSQSLNLTPEPYKCRKAVPTNARTACSFWSNLIDRTGGVFRMKQGVGFFTKGLPEKLIVNLK